MNLTQAQLDRIGQLSDQWSFMWDKRRSLWIAAEDCPGGEQIEEADLDVLLAGCQRSSRYAARPAGPASGRDCRRMADTTWPRPPSRTRSHQAEPAPAS